MDDNKILFLVEWGTAHVVTYAYGREDAKRNARHWLGYDPDRYTVTPLTATGDSIHLDITFHA